MLHWLVFSLQVTPPAQAFGPQVTVQSTPGGHSTRSAHEPSALQSKTHAVFVQFIGNAPAPPAPPAASGPAPPVVVVAGAPASFVVLAPPLPPASSLPPAPPVFPASVCPACATCDSPALPVFVPPLLCAPPELVAPPELTTVPLAPAVTQLVSLSLSSPSQALTMKTESKGAAMNWTRPRVFMT